MKVATHDLFTGEQILLEKNANALVNISEYGLQKLKNNPFGNTEAIGGRLYLTNYRIIFKSHSLNRVKGQFSIKEYFRCS